MPKKKHSKLSANQASCSKSIDLIDAYNLGDLPPVDLCQMRHFVLSKYRSFKNRTTHLINKETFDIFKRKNLLENQCDRSQRCQAFYRGFRNNLLRSDRNLILWAIWKNKNEVYIINYLVPSPFVHFQIFLAQSTRQSDDLTDCQLSCHQRVSHGTCYIQCISLLHTNASRVRKRRVEDRDLKKSQKVRKCAGSAPENGGPIVNLILTPNLSAAFKSTWFVPMQNVPTHSRLRASSKISSVKWVRLLLIQM